MHTFMHGQDSLQICVPQPCPFVKAKLARTFANFYKDQPTQPCKAFDFAVQHSAKAIVAASAKVIHLLIKRFKTAVWHSFFLQGPTCPAL